LDTSVEQSVNGHTWVYFTTDMHVPTTLLEAPSRYLGEIHLTSQSNFVANVSVALSEVTTGSAILLWRLTILN
jgi:hypothetical protein